MLLFLALFLFTYELHAAENFIRFLEQAGRTCSIPLGRDFLRVVTQGKESLLPLARANFNSFLYRHYLQRWEAVHSYPRKSPFKEINGQLLMPQFHHQLKPARAVIPPLEKFHSEIAERILKNEKAKEHRHQYLGFLPYSDYYECNMRGFETKSFSPGHQIIIHGRVPFPILGISFYDEKSKLEAHKKEKKLIHQRWLTPLEQALIMNSREEYVSQLALLKAWGNYSRFALGFIPKGANIIASIGLVSPQPSNLFNSKLNRIPSELQPGGSTQIYIYSVSNMHWVDIDALDGDKLRVAESLHDLNLLSEDEYNVISQFRDHWAKLL